MAFGGGGGANTAKSDINVTPLVDVVLVLLIIFLVAMPIVMKNIEIEIPKKLDEPNVDVVLPDQTTVEVTKAGTILLNGVEITRAELPVKLRGKLESRREKVVFVDFDEFTRYGDAVAVMDVVKGAGATKIAMKMKDANAPAGAPGTPGALPGDPAPAPAPPQNP
jgi:biopolymer transport protein ExbD